MGGSTELTGWLSKLEGVTGIEELPTDGPRRRFVLAIQNEAVIEPRISALAKERNLQISEMVPLAASLEDAFARLVRSADAASPARDGSGTGGSTHAAGLSSPAREGAHS